MASPTRSAATAVRGSEKLLRSDGLDLKQLDLLTKIVQRKGITIVDWRCKGQPAPEWLDATLQIPRSQAGRIIGDILKLEKLRLNVEGFIYGLPKVSGVSLRIRG